MVFLISLNDLICGGGGSVGADVGHWPNRFGGGCGELVGWSAGGDYSDRQLYPQVVVAYWSWVVYRMYPDI